MSGYQLFGASSVKKRRTTTHNSGYILSDTTQKDDLDDQGLPVFDNSNNREAPPSCDLSESPKVKILNRNALTRCGNFKKRAKYLYDYFFTPSIEDGQRTLAQSRYIDLKTRLYENRYIVFFVMCMLILFGIYYCYMSEVMLWSYIQDQKLQFWTESFTIDENYHAYHTLAKDISSHGPADDIIPTNSSSLPSLFSASKKSDGSNLLCFSEDNIVDPASSYIIGLGSSSLWSPTCVSSCLSLSKNDAILEKEEGACTTYIGQIMHTDNLYGRMSKAPLKYLQYHGHCLYKSNAYCNDTALAVGRCTCNCKIPSLLTFKFPLDDYLLWLLVNFNGGNLHFVDDTRLLFINHHDLDIQKKTVDELTGYHVHRQSFSDIPLQENIPHAKPPGEPTLASTDAVSSMSDGEYADHESERELQAMDSMPDTSVMYHDTNSGILSKLYNLENQMYYVSKLTESLLGRIGIASNEPEEKRPEDVSSKDMLLSFDELDLDDKTNLMSVYFTSSYSSVETKRESSVTLYDITDAKASDITLNGNGHFCSPNRFLLAQEDVSQTAKRVQTLTRFDKMNKVTRLHAQKVMDMAPVFLEKYVLIRKKVFDLVYAKPLTKGFITHIQAERSPFVYRASSTSQKEDTSQASGQPASSTMFNLHYILNYYYKILSQTPIDNNLWSPLFAINNPSFIQDIVAQRSEATPDKPPENQEVLTTPLSKSGPSLLPSSFQKTKNAYDVGDYFTVATNVLSMLSEVIDEISTSPSGEHLNPPSTHDSPTVTSNPGVPSDDTRQSSLSHKPPKKISASSIIARSLLTSRFVFGGERMNTLEEGYGNDVSKLYNDKDRSKFLLGSEPLSVNYFKMLNLDLRFDDLLGELYYLSNHFLHETQNKIQMEYTKLIDTLKIYNQVQAIASKVPKISTNLRFCACSFHLQIPLPVTYTGIRVFKKGSSPVTNVNLWYNPRIIDRSNRLNVQKDLQETYRKRKYDVMGGAKTPAEITINWENDIYSYGHLRSLIKEDWKRIQDLIEDPMINPNGTMAFPRLHTLSIMGQHFDNSSLLQSIYKHGLGIDRLDEEYSRQIRNVDVSKTKTIEKDEPLGNFILPSSTSVYSIIKNQIPSPDTGLSEESQIKMTSLFYEGQCIDYCTATWGIFSESAYILHHKDIMKESQGLEEPSYRCDKESLSKCDAMWSKLGNM
jgi:hypothetical protein